jgi:hypothetical protein
MMGFGMAPAVKGRYSPEGPFTEVLKNALHLSCRSNWNPFEEREKCKRPPFRAFSRLNLSFPSFGHVGSIPIDRSTGLARLT